ncbi:MAG: hypothetical protein EYC70_14985 [Planctomycetota bacterium]|nr:MAG: hypothetical protein EYC70_14985 [Planctomycetota bacterium]
MDPQPCFACDAMLRGLARWLRAWGYDASWTYGIADAALLEHARAEGRAVITADGGILLRKRVRAGDPPTCFVRNTEPPLQQLRRVVAAFGLARREPRCMRCGGALLAIPKESVAAEAPPRTYAWVDQYFRCQRCHGLFWRGTHFASIEARLAQVAGAADPPPINPG